MTRDPPVLPDALPQVPDTPWVPPSRDRELRPDPPVFIPEERRPLPLPPRTEESLTQHLNISSDLLNMQQFFAAQFMQMQQQIVTLQGQLAQQQVALAASTASIPTKVEVYNTQPERTMEDNKSIKAELMTKNDHGARLHVLKYKVGETRNPLILADWIVQLKTYLSSVSPRYGLTFMAKLEKAADDAFECFKRAPPEEKSSVIPPSTMDDYTRMEIELHNAVAEEVLGQMNIECQEFAQACATLDGDRRMHLLDGIFYAKTTFKHTAAPQRTGLRAAMRKHPSGVKNNKLLNWLLTRRTDITRLIALKTIDDNEDFTEYYNVVRRLMDNTNERCSWHLEKFYDGHPEPQDALDKEYFNKFLATAISLVMKYQPQGDAEGKNVDAINTDDAAKKAKKAEENAKKMAEKLRKASEQPGAAAAAGRNAKEKGDNEKGDKGKARVKPDKATLPCRLFDIDNSDQHGGCSHGADCHFSHNRALNKKVREEECRQHKVGACKFGKNCIRKHVDLNRCTNADMIHVNTLEDVQVWGIIDTAAETNIIGEIDDERDKKIGHEHIKTVLGEGTCELYATTAPIGPIQASHIEGNQNLVTMFDTVDRTLGFTWLKAEPPGGVRVGAPYVYTENGPVECPLRRGKPALPAELESKDVNHTTLKSDIGGQRFPCFTCGGIDHWTPACPLRGCSQSQICSIHDCDGVAPWSVMPDRSRRIIGKALKKAGLEEPDAFWSSTGGTKSPVDHDAQTVVDVDLDANFNVLLVREVIPGKDDGDKLWCRRVRLFYLPNSEDDVHATAPPEREEKRVRFVDFMQKEGMHSIHRVPSVEAWKQQIDDAKDFVSQIKSVNPNQVVEVPDVPDEAVTESESEDSDVEEAKRRKALKHRRKNARKKVLKQVTDKFVKRGISRAEAEKLAHAVLHAPMKDGCLPCGLTKQRRKAHSHQTGVASQRQRAWHVDTMGKIFPLGLNGEQYLVAGVEEEHDWPFCHPTKSKLSREVTGKLEDQARTLGFAPMILRSGGDTEYQGKTETWLYAQTADDGRTPMHEKTLRYSPWRLGRAEKNNGDFGDMISAITEHAGAPSCYWPLAAVYANDVRPLVEGAVERLHGNAVAEKVVKNLVPFGTKATMVREGPERDQRKFGHTSIEGFVIGFDGDAYRFAEELPDGKVKVTLSQNVRTYLDQKTWNIPKDDPRRAPIRYQTEAHDEGLYLLKEGEDAISWVECTTCQKWREVTALDMQELGAQDVVTCNDMSTDCAQVQDPRGFREPVVSAVTHDSEKFIRVRDAVDTGDSREVNLFQSVKRSIAFSSVEYANTGKTYADLFVPALRREIGVYADHNAIDMDAVRELPEVFKDDPDALLLLLNDIHGFKDSERPDPVDHRAKSRIVCYKELMLALAGHLEETDGIDIDEVLSCLPPSYGQFRAFAGVNVARGKKLTLVDFPGAYLISRDKGKRKAWARLPRNGWPDEWVGKFKDPVVPVYGALYGRKRAGFDWDKTADEGYEELDFQSLRELDIAPAVYARREREEGQTTSSVLRYTDDNILACDDGEENRIWTEIGTVFPVPTDEDGNPKYEKPPFKYIGVNTHVEEITDDITQITFEQIEYLIKCVAEVKESAEKKGIKVKPHDGPMSTETEYGFRRTTGTTPEDEFKKYPGIFAQECKHFLGELNFVQKCGRPDITYACSVISSNLDRWGVTDDRNFLYLVGYLDKYVDLVLVGYVSKSDWKNGLVKLAVKSDASFANSFTRKGHSGWFLVLVGPNTYFVCDWAGRGQKCQSLSSTETEHHAAVDATRNGIRMCMFIDGLCGLGLFQVPEQEEPIKRQLESDSQAMLQAYRKGLSTQLAHCRRTHGISLAWAHEQWKDQELVKRDGFDLEPDMLTKSMPTERMAFFRDLIGLKRM